MEIDPNIYEKVIMDPIYLIMEYSDKTLNSPYPHQNEFEIGILV